MAEPSGKSVPMTWVTRVIESRRPFPVKPPLLAALSKFGLVPAVLLAALYGARRDRIGDGFILSYALVWVWAAFGPYWIWYYERKLMPAFYSRLRTLLADPTVIPRMEYAWRREFSRKYLLASAPWSLFLLVTWFYCVPSLSRGGIGGLADPVFWVTTLAVLWLGVLTGIGFWGVAVTVRAIHAVTHHRLRIDPWHPDGLGGLSSVGYYAIGTTLLFSTGSLFLPLAFQLIDWDSPLAVLVPGAVVLFSGFIGLSFVWPTLAINREATALRDARLDALRDEHETLTRNVENESLDDMAMIRTYLRINRVSSQYQILESMMLYPFKVSILARLVFSVVLPFVFIFLRRYLSAA